MGPRRAAFIDRDGVLNQDHGYVVRSADFHWLPGAISALQRLQQAGLALVVVTNQSGIARGYYTQADFDQLCQHMREQLQPHGVRLDGIYACPHHPQAPVAAYRSDCDCRKPRPGLLLQAIDALGLDPAASVLFGDKPSDIAAGRSAGVGCCWLIGDNAALAASGADAVAGSLDQASQRWLAGTSGG